MGTTQLEGQVCMNSITVTPAAWTHTSACAWAPPSLPTPYRHTPVQPDDFSRKRREQGIFLSTPKAAMGALILLVP